ncbi:alpha/beta hydrolase [Pengzhenrongella sicca]|uniref:Alpha/beta hydrolase n=1 Tax=Pengzhenrongella sicca TaxID=2819238 RepID=A0A8A4ZGA9_9MICO|nr:alpha/beta hydrolase [Pengzhenrongella sicca]QTE31070.1 alpha/beta hydrolase [Pengzhenrongella sicca]
MENQLKELAPDVAGSDDTHAEPSPNDNSSVFLAVTCDNTRLSGDVSDYQRAVAKDRKQCRVFGAATANIMPCAFWPYEQAEVPVAMVDDAPENNLIVQHRRDPVTPYAGSAMLHERFDNRSKPVSVDGSGHGVFIYGDSACADNLTTTFLVDGKMPSKDRRC